METTFGGRVHTSPQCAHCGQMGAQKRCSRCSSVYYCNVDCHKAHWKEHKLVCRAPTASSEGQPAFQVVAFAGRADLGATFMLSVCLVERGKQIPTCASLCISMREPFEGAGIRNSMVFSSELAQAFGTRSLADARVMLEAFYMHELEMYRDAWGSRRIRSYFAPVPLELARVMLEAALEATPGKKPPAECRQALQLMRAVLPAAALGGGADAPRFDAPLRALAARADGPYARVRAELGAMDPVTFAGTCHEFFSARAEYCHGSNLLDEVLTVWDAPPASLGPCPPRGRPDERKRWLLDILSSRPGARERFARSLYHNAAWHARRDEPAAAAITHAAAEQAEALAGKARWAHECAYAIVCAVRTDFPDEGNLHISRDSTRTSNRAGLAATTIDPAANSRELQNAPETISMRERANFGHGKLIAELVDQRVSAQDAPVLAKIPAKREAILEEFDFPGQR